jgi:hypothetical protein
MTTFQRTQTAGFPKNFVKEGALRILNFKFVQRTPGAEISALKLLQGESDENLPIIFD